MMADRLQIRADLLSLVCQAMARRAFALESGLAALRIPLQRRDSLLILLDDFVPRTGNVGRQQYSRPVANLRIGMLHQEPSADGTNLSDADFSLLDFVQQQ